MAAAGQGGGSSGGSTRQIGGASMWGRDETSGRSDANVADMRFPSSVRHSDSQPTHTLETYYPKMLEKLENMQEKQRQSDEIREQLERDKRELQRQLSSQTKKLELMETALENEKESSRIHANILNERIDALKDQIRAHEELNERSAKGNQELEHKEKEIQLLNEAIEELEREKDHAVLEERKRCEAETEKVLNFLAKTLEELEMAKEKNKEVFSLKKEILELQTQLEELPYAQKICDIYAEFFNFVDNCACLNEAGSHKWKETDRNIRIHRRTRVERGDRSASPFSKATASPRLSENDPILASTKDKSMSIESKDSSSKEMTDTSKKHSDNDFHRNFQMLQKQNMKETKSRKALLLGKEREIANLRKRMASFEVRSDAPQTVSSKQSVDPADIQQDSAAPHHLTESGDNQSYKMDSNDFLQVAAELKHCQEKLVYWQNESKYLAEQVRLLQKQCQESSLRRNEALKQVQDLQIRLKEQEIMHTSKESAYTEASQKNLDSLESQLETAKSQCRIFSDELLDKTSEISNLKSLIQKYETDKFTIQRSFDQKLSKSNLQLSVCRDYTKELQDQIQKFSNEMRNVTIQISETFRGTSQKSSNPYMHESQDMLNTTSAISNIMNDMNYIQRNFDRLATDIQPFLNSHATNQNDLELHDPTFKQSDKRNTTSQCQYQAQMEIWKRAFNENANKLDFLLRMMLSQKLTGIQCQVCTEISDCWNALTELMDLPLRFACPGGHDVKLSSEVHGTINHIGNDMQDDVDLHVLPVHKLSDICDEHNYQDPSPPPSEDIRKVNIKLNFSELDELGSSHEGRERSGDYRQRPRLPKKSVESDCQPSDTSALVERLQHQNSALSHQLSLKSTEVEILYGELENIKSSLGNEEFSISDLHTELSIAAVKAEAQLQILQLEERVRELEDERDDREFTPRYREFEKKFEILETEESVISRAVSLGLVVDGKVFENVRESVKSLSNLIVEEVQSMNEILEWNLEELQVTIREREGHVIEDLESMRRKYEREIAEPLQTKLLEEQNTISQCRQRNAKQDLLIFFKDVQLEQFRSKYSKAVSIISESFSTMSELAGIYQDLFEACAIQSSLETAKRMVLSTPTNHDEENHMTGQKEREEDNPSVKNMIMEKKSPHSSEEHASPQTSSPKELKPLIEINDKPKSELTDMISLPCKIEVCIKTARISDKHDMEELGFPYLIVVLDHKNGRSARRKTLIGESKIHTDVKRSLARLAACPCLSRCCRRELVVIMEETFKFDVFKIDQKFAFTLFNGPGAHADKSSKIPKMIGCGNLPVARIMHQLESVDPTSISLSDGDETIGNLFVQFSFVSSLNMVDRAFSMAESEPGEVSHFDHLLSFPQEIAPVFDSLTAEQEDRRIFDYVRNREVGRNLERINEILDQATKERIESDVLLDKLYSTKLSAMQRLLTEQIERGFKKSLRYRKKGCGSPLELQTVSVHRQQQDIDFRVKIPPAVLSVYRMLQDEKDVCEGLQAECRERCLPLEHSDLNDIEHSVAQQVEDVAAAYLPMPDKEIHDLVSAITQEELKDTQVHDRIAEEKAQAARARALTDALSQGLKIVNASAPLP
ncbi:hypothetical protein GUITHDRAFT_143134 [Guillardia theta CCMP2712]|uniref:C2 domain-containing protein n=2 Tax=Guillardia theta TaxID=55529 RepID=L1IUR8_GUITC|nr:hypothetical protein GUITHDRAFT_143134 [Guillardia theta CCMP2712]EKX39978.1 hypothetical protein GUITHDRAFT_143134 [Guillardia theta CCMP2712]|eukprot:XP_005826958.1 hypothetical protein GUITHDRAFT_143134 [Guillardia theta CCMP2712]